MDASCRVGLVGVGAMGGGVARALLARGLPVVVRDLVRDREAELEREGARGAASAALAAAQADVLVTLVVDAAQTRAVLFGPEGVLEARAVPPVVMMCSTIAPRDAEDIAARLAARGVAMLDAPISGGPARARAGTLSMMVSGADEALARARPAIDAMAAKVFRMGEHPGDGSRMKMVNNMLAAANLAAGCEAMAMAARLGLDLGEAARVVEASSGASWIFSDRIPRALRGDYAPRAAARVLLKDVGIFADVARELGLTAPMAECAREVFRDTVARGHAEEDDAAVLRRYAEAWRLELPSAR